MDLIEYREKRRSDNIVVKEAKFESVITDEVNTLEDIYNKFKNYRFWEYLDNFREEFNCQLSSDIKYYLRISYQHKGLYFRRFLIASLSIPNKDDTDFLSIPFYDEKINNILKNELYDTVKVEAEMEIKFLLFCSLTALNEYEAEQIEDLYDEGDDNEYEAEQIEDLYDEEDDDEGYQDNQLSSLTIETPFISDGCSVCLTVKPNILFIPCLHLATCEKCEENGKLIKCSVCRETIERKIKI